MKRVLCPKCDNYITFDETKYTDQWNRIKNPEINPDTYGQSIFDKRAKNIKLEKDSLFSRWYR